MTYISVIIGFNHYLKGEDDDEESDEMKLMGIIALIGMGVLIVIS